MGITLSRPAAVPYYYGACGFTRYTQPRNLCGSVYRAPDVIAPLPARGCVLDIFFGRSTFILMPRERCSVFAAGRIAPRRSPSSRPRRRRARFSSNRSLTTFIVQVFSGSMNALVAGKVLARSHGVRLYERTITAQGPLTLGSRRGSYGTGPSCSRTVEGHRGRRNPRRRTAARIPRPAGN